MTNTETAPRDPRDLILTVHERLCQTYGCPVSYFHSLDPLSELISSLLSHRTRNADSGRAFKNLRRRFKTWEEVRDAPVADVMHELEPVTWPEQKAPRVQFVLREVTIRRDGNLSLDFLKDMDGDEAQEWLEDITGIGPKTSAAVLIFSNLRKRALPVDSHHHRVAQRLGLISEKTAVGPAHKILKAQLPEDWSAQQLYDNHEVLMFHGQRCCFYQSPACGRCVLLDLCPTGQKRMQKQEAQVGSPSPRQPSAPPNTSPAP